MQENIISHVGNEINKTSGTNENLGENPPTLSFQISFPNIVTTHEKTNMRLYMIRGSQQCYK